MDKVFKDAWNAHSDDVRKAVAKMCVNDDEFDEVSYRGLLECALDEMFRDGGYGCPDASRMVVIDHGDYQGDLLFVIPEDCYRPSSYWISSASYGSCSGCDSLQAALYRNDSVEERAHDLWLIVLGIVEKAVRYDCFMGRVVE